MSLRLRRALLGFGFAALLVASAPGAAHALGQAEPEPHGAPRLALRVLGEAPAGAPDALELGLGVELDLHVAPHLEVALSIGLFEGDPGWRVPVEVLGELLLVERPGADVYVGLGPALVSGRESMAGGLAFAAGAHFGLAGRGVQLELLVQRLGHRGAAEAVVGAALGVHWRP